VEPLAVTGVGAVTPLGIGVQTLHRRWLAGEVGVVDGVGRCRDLVVSEFLSRREIRGSDRFTQLALVASEEAIAQAGWAAEMPYPPHRVGVVVATSIGGIQTCLEQQEVARVKGYRQVSPLAVVMQMPNAAAAMIAQRWGFQGEAAAIVGACASGTLAFGMASRLLASGTVDAVVVGGSDSAITEQAAAAFSIMGALSESGIVRPFDRRRDGFVMGEGAAVFVLERPEAARTSGREVLGEVIGFGASTDAFHPSAPEPTGAIAARAIEDALKSARLGQRDVDYVNSHGTASRHNDLAETRAIKRVFGEAAPGLAISSTKSAIGHLMGAAGTVEAASTLMALRDRVAPPTLGLEEPDDELDLNYVPGSAQPFSPKDGRLAVGISESFGLGGHNAVVAMRA
jgi:3-oxoacyl-[acyl-carrier-protein] synthase II